MVHFILATDVDYGTIASEASFSSDFGTQGQRMADY